MAVKKKEKVVEVGVIERGEFTACLLGTTPHVSNRMAEKAKRELLFPGGRKSAAQRQSTLKHKVLEEFRQSPYTNKSTEAETLFEIVAASVKKAIASIPLDIPDTGTTKSQLERIVYAPQDKAPLWGIPQVSLDIVRMADMNKTPDIRIRAFIRQWATKVTISFVKPVLRQDTVVKLLSCAGFMRGIGDWRPEKGSGNFGTFEVVEPDDPRFLHIIKTGGREAQIAAMANPEYYDEDSRELHDWYKEELVRRGFNTEEGAPPVKKAKTKDKGNGAQAQV